MRPWSRFGRSAVLEDGRDVLVPFAQAICKEIDVAAKTIRAELPEGLLDQ